MLILTVVVAGWVLLVFEAWQVNLRLKSFLVNGLKISEFSTTPNFSL